jgi:hypothetical protein
LKPIEILEYALMVLVETPWGIHRWPDVYQAGTKAPAVLPVVPDVFAGDVVGLVSRFSEEE